MAKIKPPGPTPDFKQIFRLAEMYFEASKLLENQARSERWGCTGPKLLVDSFAVELYLKCLFVMDTGYAPEWEHDWEKLFNQLTSNTKHEIREAFNRIIKNDTVMPLLPQINPEAAKVLDFDRSLLAAKSTFDKKRYLYDTSQDQGKEFYYAHLLGDAIRAVAKMDLRLHGVK